MAVLQCPACELRFTLASELDQHISLEHPDLNTQDTTNDATSRSAIRQRQIHRKESER